MICSLQHRPPGSPASSARSPGRLEAGIPVHSSMTLATILLRHRVGSVALRLSSSSSCSSRLADCGRESWPAPRNRLAVVAGLEHFLLSVHSPCQGLARSRRTPPASGVAQGGAGAGLVQQVDGLVRQKAVGDVPLGQHHRRGGQIFVGDLHPVVALVIALDAQQDLRRCPPQRAPPP